MFTERKAETIASALFYSNVLSMFSGCDASLAAFPACVLYTCTREAHTTSMVTKVVQVTPPVDLPIAVSVCPSNFQVCNFGASFAHT